MQKVKAYRILPQILNDYSDKRWVSLTLFANDCSPDDLRTTLDLMNKSLNRLTKLKKWPGVGWIKSVIVSQGCDGYVRPHFHILMTVKSSYFGHGYLSQKSWVEVWQRSLRVDYVPDLSVQLP